MDIQTIISAIESWLSLIVIWNLVLTVFVVVFLVAVPKALKDIDITLRMMYRDGFRTGVLPPPPPVYDDKKDEVNPKIDVNSQFWHKN